MKYDFKYRLIKLNGDVEESTLKAKHERSVRKILGWKYPGCNIVECVPDNPREQYGSISKDLW